MTTPRYLLAKYIPDLQRFEPQNIGVIVWSPETVEARFIGENPNKPGFVDGRRAPSFVRDLSAYKAWVRHWRDEIVKPELTIANGSTAKRSAPEYLRALASTSSGKFHLTEAGFLFDKTEAENMPALADHLFELLVKAADTDDTATDATLDALCKELLDETLLSNDERLIADYPVTCNVLRVRETFRFSYAYSNGSLKKVYQKVPLVRGGQTLKKNVHHPAWMFQHSIMSKKLRREQCATIVNVKSDLASEPEVKEALKLLGAIGTVVNLSDWGAAVAEFSSLRIH